jgi:hypothetical protein
MAVLPMVGVAVCVYSLVSLMPRDDSAALEAAAKAGRTHGGIQVTTTAAAPLAGYAAIWQRNLRQPMVDAPPPAAAPKPTLNVTLMGTAVEPGRAEGMFREGNGSPRWVKVGEVIGGARVTAIDDTSATLEFGGSPVTLTVTKGPARP